MDEAGTEGRPIPPVPEPPIPTVPPPPAGNALAVSGANMFGRIPSAEALREITLLARRFLEAARRCHDGDVARFRQGGEGGSSPDRSLCAAHDDFYKRLDESDAICPYGWPDVVRVTLERFRDYGGGLRGWGEIAFVNRETGEYEPARAEAMLGEMDRAIGDLEGATDAPPADNAPAASGAGAPAQADPPHDGETSAPKPIKSKRSTERGDGREKLIAALTKHHKYADGGCLNLEPIGNNELARMAVVSGSTASQFFKDKFRGHSEYMSLCRRNPSKLGSALKLLNGEYSPHDLYGRRPADEDDRDDE